MIVIVATYRRVVTHTVAYNDHEADQDVDGQQITEIFHLSDDISDQYQKSCISDQTELDTEPDTDENDNADGTRSITRHQSQAGRNEPTTGYRLSEFRPPPDRRKPQSSGVPLLHEHV